ncbi:MAG: xylulokinase [Thermoprotei archaeon]|nr:MAG: xylulokinase [Thermoprotei archaeon]
MVEKEYFLVYDLGTSGVKAVLFNTEGRAIAREYRRYNTYYVRPQWVEQSPEEWWVAVVESTRNILRKTKIPPEKIAAISFSGQMMGAVPVDKEGNLLMKRVIIWEDMRAVEESEHLEKNFGWEEFYKRTGSGMAVPMYPLVKIAWIKKHLSEIYEKTHKFIQCKDYIRLKLTGKIASDYTDASNTGMLNIHKRTWDEEVVSFMGIDMDKLPDLYESHDVVGYVTDEAAKVTGLKPGTPVVAGAGDVPAAAVGAGVVKEGISYICTGTAFWSGIFTNSPMISPQYRICTLCSMIPGKYTPHQFTHSGSASIDWFIEHFLISEKEGAERAGISIYDVIQIKAEQVPIGSGGLVFLPYLMGGGAPHNKSYIKGGFLNLTLAHRKEHFIRAIMEGVALTMREIIEIFREEGAKIELIRLIGGSAQNATWRKIMADVLGVELLVPELLQEANCLAAAVAAGIGVGIYKDYSIVEKLIRDIAVEKPDSEAHKIYTEIYKVYKNIWRTLDSIYKQLFEVGLKYNIF